MAVLRPGDDLAWSRPGPRLCNGRHGSLLARRHLGWRLRDRRHLGRRLVPLRWAAPWSGDEWHLGQQHLGRRRLGPTTPRRPAVTPAAHLRPALPESATPPSSGAHNESDASARVSPIEHGRHFFGRCRPRSATNAPLARATSGEQSARALTSIEITAVQQGIDLIRVNDRAHQHKARSHEDSSSRMPSWSDSSKETSNPRGGD